MYYSACVHTKRFCGGVKKVCGRPFKMRSAGLVKTETFFGVALVNLSNLCVYIAMHCAHFVLWEVDTTPEGRYFLKIALPN